MSERRICHVQHRSTQRRQPRGRADEARTGRGGDHRVPTFIVEIVANIIPVDIAHGVPGGGEDAAVVAFDKAGRGVKNKSYIISSNR